jgi:hypothetical protein
MTTRWSGALTAALLVAALTILPVPARAAVFINAYMPVDATSFDPCTNEVVDLTGTAHVQGSLTVNGNRIHLSAHVNYNIEGIGETSGLEYDSNADALAEESVETDNVNVGEATLIARVVIIGPGSLPNAFAEIVSHITVLPDGTITSFPVHVVMRCH